MAQTGQRWTSTRCATPSAWASARSRAAARRLRAVARTFFSEEVSDWSCAESWLRGPEAHALLEAIAGGQNVDLIWTGDFVVEWSEAALSAGRELHAGVQRAVGIGAGTVSS
jgi:hypothetical protein